MKPFYLFATTCIIGVGLMMQGCEADVDLNNIDTSVKVNANIATPVGSMRATLGDFVGDGTWGIFVENGVLTFKDTFSIERNFHQMDLKKYISNTSVTMNVYEKLADLNILNNGKVTGTGQTIALNFPLTLKLNGINSNEDHQRLDSALIKNASFVSNIAKAGDLPLEWEWIDKVTISMSPEFFHRAAGNDVVVYSRGQQGGYNQNININVDEFSINLMKNKNPENFRGYWNNVKDYCEFVITMQVTIPQGKEVAIPQSAAFQYNLGVQFIDYAAIWGMFEPSNDMSGEDEITIADHWGPWNDLKAAKLPFANPSIDAQITTQIAGALKVTGDYLYVKDENDQPVYATFDGDQHLYKTFHKNEYLPLDSEIGASKTMHQLFDKDEQRGRIDRLFAVHPEKLGYKFQIDFDQAETPQIRITDNTSIKVDAVCNLPMVFNEGVVLDYSDTITGIDLTVLNEDSLMQYVPDMVDTIQEASAVVALTFTNDIPFQFKAVVTCLDENNNVIIDPKTEKPLLITENDTILIPSPEYTYNDLALTWTPKPVEHVETVYVDREDLETLRKIKSIAFYALMDDKSLSEVYKAGNFNAKLTDGEGLRIKVGVGANVEAILQVLETGAAQ